LLALLWYIQRILKNLRLASAQAWTPILKPVSEIALTTPGSLQLQPAGGKYQIAQLDQSDALYRQMPERQPKPESLPQPQPEIRLPSLPKVEVPVLTEEDQELMESISKLAEEDPASLASILQIWLSEDENSNG
jgi:hypothetical protein